MLGILDFELEYDGVGELGRSNVPVKVSSFPLSCSFLFSCLDLEFIQRKIDRYVSFSHPSTWETSPAPNPSVMVVVVFVILD